MKKLILLLIVMASFTFSNVALADNGPVGRSVSIDNLGNLNGPLEQWFVNVKNSEGASISNGRVVILDVADDDGYSVEIASAASGQVPYCVMAEVCADGKVCKCQTYGLKTDIQFDAANGSAVAGKKGFISEDTEGSVEYEASPAATDYAIGIFYDSPSATAETEFFIDLR